MTDMRESASADDLFDLAIEQPLAVSKRFEAEVLRAAVRAGPEGKRLRNKLGSILYYLDEFEEAIELLEESVAEAPTFYALYMLAEAYLSRETEADDLIATDRARRALEIADSPDRYATAAAALGKALNRQDRTAEAHRVLRDALHVAPANVVAFKRLAALHLNAGDPAAALAVADSAIANGVGHARVLIARALALGALGDVEQARATIGLDRYLYRGILPPPPGYDTIEAFNATIKAELEAHPDLRYDRYGTASSKTWRVDEPAIAGSVAVPALQALIQRVVIDHVERILQHDSAWTRAAPRQAMLHNWCVLTDAEGYEEWHVHQNGWMSGVYYVEVPPAIRDGAGREGCLVFGLPGDQVGDDAAAAYGEQIVRPQNGLVLLFPSHTFHRTFPHGSDRRRICMAFDIVPH